MGFCPNCNNHILIMFSNVILYHESITFCFTSNTNLKVSIRMWLCMYVDCIYTYMSIRTEYDQHTPQTPRSCQGEVRHNPNQEEKKKTYTSHTQNHNNNQIIPHHCSSLHVTKRVGVGVITFDIIILSLLERCLLHPKSNQILLRINHKM